MRVVFMGTPEFSVTALEAIQRAGHEVVCVYTQPPRPAGRGKAPRLSPVMAAAQANDLTVLHPVSLKSPQEQASFAELGSDVAVVVAYGLILPQSILDAPRLGCLNIHASLLPRWRGAAPIQRAIMSGDTETGICIMQMDAGLDTGPVLDRAETSIESDTTAGQLHDSLAVLGAKRITAVLDNIGAFVPIPQSDTGATYATKIDKAEARINWEAPAVTVDRLIRGLSPFPGAWSEINGTRVKFLGSKVVKVQGVPGTILDDQMTIACGNDAVRITCAQRPGKSAMPTETFMRGFDASAGTMAI